MSKARYKKLVSDLHNGLKEAEEEMGMEISVYDVANDALMSHTWVTEHLQARGVTDVSGCLADDIYSG